VLKEEDDELSFVDKERERIYEEWKTIYKLSKGK